MSEQLLHTIGVPTQHGEGDIMVEDFEHDPLALDGESLEKTREGFMRLFQEHSLAAPGGDQRNAMFYRALAEIAEEEIIVPKTPEGSQQNTSLLDMIIATQTIRRSQGRSMTKIHAANLAIHAVNYIMMFREGQLDYPIRPENALDTSEGWKKLLKDTVLAKHSSELGTLFLDKDIQTTDTRRGVVMPLIANRFFKDRSEGINVLDLGCSTNWVWANLANGSHFEGIEDISTDPQLNGVISEHAEDKIKINRVVGVDRTDPLADEEGINWFLACRHFGEVNPEAIAATRKQIEQYRDHTENVTFVKGDVLDENLAINPPLPDELSEEEFKALRNESRVDIVSLFTISYQWPKEIRDMMIERYMGVINQSNGLLVIQDYCEISPEGQLYFTKSRKPHTYSTVIRGPRTGDKWMQLATFENTRCKKVAAGKDLQEVLEITA